MIIEDLQVGDTATYYYNIWGQQVLVRGEVIEIMDNYVLFSNDKAKYLHKVPNNHLLRRDKRPDEIEKEKQKIVTKKMEDAYSKTFQHLSGIILVDRITKQELNSAKGEATKAWIDIEKEQKEKEKEDEVMAEPVMEVIIESKQEKWRDYNGKHRNQTNESRSESR